MGLVSYINTAPIPIPIPEALYSTSKAYVKSSKAKTGAKHNLSFNMLKALSCSSSHLNPTDFLTILVKGVVIILNSFTNHLQKLASQ